MSRLTPLTLPAETIESQTYTPGRRFSRNVAITLVARAVQVSAGLGANILIARWLGESGLGALAVINVTAAVALQLASLGQPSANVYFISRDRRLLGPLWANSLVFGVLAGVITILLLALLLWARPQFFGEVPPRLLLVAALAVPVQVLTVVGLNLLLGLDRVDAYNLLDTTANSVNFISAVLTLLVAGGGLALLVYGNTAGAILVGVAVAVLILALWRRQQERSPLRPSWGLFRQTLSYGLKFHVSILAGFLLVRVDLLLVNHYRGTRDAGIYAAAAQIGMLLLLLPSVVSSLLFPRIAAAVDERGAFAMRVTRHLVLIMLAACLITIPASLLLPVVYGQKFSGAVMLLLLLLPGVFLLGIESVLVQHFNAIGLPRAIPVYWLIALVVNLALNFVFIPRFGAAAAAINSTIGYAVIFALVAIRFRRQTGNRLSETFLLRRSEWRGMLTLLRTRSTTVRTD